MKTKKQIQERIKENEKYRQQAEKKGGNKDFCDKLFGENIALEWVITTEQTSALARD